MRAFILAPVLLSLLLGINAAYAVTWIEIAQFPVYWGTAPNVLHDRSTDNFTCGYSEWRIVWSYTPISIADPNNVYFNILIYRTNDTINYITEMNQQGTTITNGTFYVNNTSGEFYLKFLVYNVLNSTATVEQDIESTPEFSPLFMLSLFTIAMLVTAIFARKKHSLS